MQHNEPCGYICLTLKCKVLTQIILYGKAAIFTAGVCGIALSMAGAKVILTDLPHITGLTQHNLTLNCGEQQHSKVRSPGHTSNLTLNHVSGQSQPDCGKLVVVNSPCYALSITTVY